MPNRTDFFLPLANSGYLLRSLSLKAPILTGEYSGNCLSHHRQANAEVSIALSDFNAGLFDVPSKQYVNITIKVIRIVDDFISRIENSQLINAVLLHPGIFPHQGPPYSRYPLPLLPGGKLYPGYLQRQILLQH